MFTFPMVLTSKPVRTAPNQPRQSLLAFRSVMNMLANGYAMDTQKFLVHGWRKLFERDNPLS